MTSITSGNDIIRATRRRGCWSAAQKSTSARCFHHGLSRVLMW